MTRPAALGRRLADPVEDHRQYHDGQAGLQAGADAQVLFVGAVAEGDIWNVTLRNAAGTVLADGDGDGVSFSITAADVVATGDTMSDTVNVFDVAAALRGEAVAGFTLGGSGSGLARLTRFIRPFRRLLLQALVLNLAGELTGLPKQEAIKSIMAMKAASATQNPGSQNRILLYIGIGLGLVIVLIIAAILIF